MADIQLLNNQGITVFKSLEQCFSGGVYLGYKGDTGLVSVKVRNIDQVGERELDAIERFKEMEAIPFVSQYKEIIKLEKQIIILNDFANMKSIEHIIKNKYSLSSGTFRALAKQIFEGIRYINSIDIILRDINAENLLLHCPHGSNRVIVKIAGFECAKVLGKYQTNNLEQEDKSFKMSAIEQQFGFRQNMAPELDIEGEKADSRVDGWSSGVVLFQLAGHDHPIKAKTIDELKNFIKFQTIVRPAAIQDDQLWDLLTHLLDFNRKTRYSAELALQHPYFTSPSFEISAEANEIAIQSLYDKQQGDKSITIYDQDSTYIVPKSEIKAALEYDPDIDLQPIYHQIQQQQIIGRRLSTNSGSS
ncbi:MAG: hypothetical protein EZS28_002276 [Streblomastix strix]|uniref:Protein kinase domain-containing protein n=1 Tax=Streblomastix strix TaxID=222440 RepID=A0A5J4X5B7_9EUKA|nr:MAG: hypothetical protein EZS28_002276 [Streblomastix strix]